MHKKLATILIAAALLIPAWAGMSANYRIVTEVLDSGGATGQSASYAVLGKTRDKEMQVPFSANYRIGEGFLRAAYFPRILFAPIVTGINPPTALNTETISATVTGANFVPGATVMLTQSGQPDIVATEVVVVDTGKITCKLTLGGAKGGLWSVTVTNPDGRSGTLPAGFKITYPAPKVMSITPDKGINNEVVNITNLAGSDFRAGATVKLSKSGENDIPAENVVVVSPEKITCSFNLTGKAVGRWDVVVTNDDGQSATLPNAFKVEAPELEVIGPVINTPNPFNPLKEPTVINYVLSKDSDINIDIFNIRGERVWSHRVSAGADGGQVGKNGVTWNGVTAFKQYASDGVYLMYVSGKVKGVVKILGKGKAAVVK